MTTTAQDIYCYDGGDHTWTEFITAMHSGEVVEIDEEMHYYWLEVLPPVYMNRTINGRYCVFGAAEGADLIVDFFKKDGRYFCQQSTRRNRLS